MKFDIQAARSAGYSDDEIADYLATENKFDLGGALSSGYSSSDVIDFFGQAEAPEPPPPPEPVQEAPSFLSNVRTNLGQVGRAMSNAPGPLGAVGTTIEALATPRTQAAPQPAAINSVFNDFRPQMGDPGFDPMLNPQFVEGFRAELGSLPVENRLPALRQYAENDKSVYGRAARVILAQEEYANQKVDANSRRQAGLLVDAPRIQSPVGSGGGAGQPARAVFVDATPNFIEQAQGMTAADKGKLEELARSVAAVDEEVRRNPELIESRVRQARIDSFVEQNPTMGWVYDKYAGETLKGLGIGIKAFTDVFGAGNVASDAIESVIDGISARQSTQQKEAEQRRGEIMEEYADGGIIDQLKGAAKAFAVDPAGMMFNTLGIMGPMVLGGKVLAGTKAVQTIGAGGARLIGKAGSITAATTAGSAITGGVMGAGFAKGAIYDSVFEMAKAEGYTDADAKRIATKSQSYTENPDLIALVAVATAAGAGTGVEPLILNALGRESAKQLLKQGVIKSVAGSVLREVPLEMLQGGSEAFAANKAAQRAGFDIDPMRGVWGNAFLEGMASGGFAAGAGVAQSNLRLRDETRQEAASRALSDVLQDTDVQIAGGAEAQALRQLDPNATDPTLIDPRQTVRGDMVGPAAQATTRVTGESMQAARVGDGTISFTPDTNLTSQAGLTPIVVPDPAITMPMEPTGMQPGDMATVTVPGALPQQGATQAATLPTGTLTRTQLGRSSDADLLARATAAAGPVDTAPVEQWFGRKGDGYLTAADAQQALPGRQRMFTDLNWSVEEMPNGKFRLAGYSTMQETNLGTQTTQAQQAEAQGQQAAAAVPAAVTGQQFIADPALAATADTITFAPGQIGALKVSQRRDLNQAFTSQEMDDGSVVFTRTDAAPIDAAGDQGQRAARPAGAQAVDSPLATGVVQTLNDASLRSGTPQRYVAVAPQQTAQAGTALAIARTFSKPVVFVRASSGKAGFNAYYDPGFDGIVINADSTSPMFAAVLHEVGHSMPDSIRRSMVDAVLQTVTPAQRARFKQEFPFYDRYSQDVQNEELVMRIIEQDAQNPELWQRMADRMGDTAFARFARDLVQMLDKLMASFTREDSREFTSDIERVRDIVADAYAQTLERMGQDRAGATPEGVRASAPRAGEQQGREFKLTLDKTAREKKQVAGISAAERAAVEADAAKFGLTTAQVNQILESARETKKLFPQSAGWAPLELAGVTIKTDDSDVFIGVEPKFKPIAYGFNRPPGKTRAPAKMDQELMQKVADQFEKLISDIYQRAEAGDKNAQIIIGHQTWYRNVAEVLRREYGAQGDLLADLLGATSPNTPVDTNWRFSVEILRRFVRGDFNAELAKFDRYTKDGGAPSKYPAAEKIRQVSGKLYGMNSTNAMVALLDMWRVFEPGSAPKARNFALNLIGQSNMATIDVWAARMLRRAANQVRGISLPRIPPPAEKGVTGAWNAQATGVSGEFGFGAAVMQEVSDRLAKEGRIISPPDLQAIAWFAEKELWGSNRWTTVTGEGGSFEENIQATPVERYLAGWSIQQGQQTPGAGETSIAQARVMSMLVSDESVIAARVMPTYGLYGGVIEQSFDTEWTATKGDHNPIMAMAEIARLAQENQQYDMFVSRVLGENEDSANARPGVEIYFRNQRDLQEAMPVLERFTARGQDGFTMAVDPRAQAGGESFIGVRLQYVPEISARFDLEARAQMLQEGGIEGIIDVKSALLNDIAAEVSAMPNVAFARRMSYDTVVVGKENYDAYIDTASTGGNQSPRGQAWFGQPVRQAVERAVARYEGEQGAVDAGRVPAAGSEVQPDSRFSVERAARPAEPARGPGARPDAADGQQVTGIHYGKRAGLSQLNGTSFGTGIRGAEQERLNQPGVDPRIKKRVYFYLTNNNADMPRPEIGLGVHVYRANLGNMYDTSRAPQAEVQRVRSLMADSSANAFEAAVLDAGYRGYVNREQGTAVALNADVPVAYEGLAEAGRMRDRAPTRLVPRVETRTEGSDFVRRPTGDEMTGIVRARPALAEAAPSFRLEFGEARVAQTEAAAADQVFADAGAAFRFGDGRMMSVDRGIGAALQARVDNDFDTLVTEYGALPGTNGGRLLDADLARELSPEYRQDKTRAAEVHDASSSFVQKLFEQRIAQPHNGGSVVLMAGGGGAGKSSANTLLAAELSGASTILDGTLSNYDKARGNIQRVLDSGRSVVVAYVYRDPVESLTNGVLIRAMETGRTVPADALVKGHVESNATVRRLAKDFAGNEYVQLRVVDNSRGAGNAARVELSDITPVIESGLKERFINATTQEYEAGRVSEAVYNATIRDAGTAAQVAGEDAPDAEGGRRTAGQGREPGGARYSVERTALGFYSELTNRIGDGPNQAPKDQWKAYIKGLQGKGVKADEVTWSGIEDWLELQEGKVKKADVLEYMNSNGVQVQEVVLADADKWIVRMAGDPTTYRFDNEAEAERFVRDEVEAQVNDQLLPDDEYDAALLDARDRVIMYEPGEWLSVAKYESYTLPGGANYREVLLTVPQAKPSKDDAAQAIFNLKYDQLGPNQKLDADRLIESGKLESPNLYRSSHFDQPNIVSHIRLNDRTGADGSKVLFVEEVQSDWGQDGKKRGFGAVTRFEYEAVQENGQLVRTFREKDEAEAFAKERGLQLREIPFNVDTGVPLAPFVNKTDGWVNLSLKRIMTIAVEGDYDKVAFVTGQQAVDRYSLSKQVDRVEYFPESKTLVAVRSGSPVITESNVNADRLEALIGKEAAQRMLDRPMVPALRVGETNMQVLEGEALKVGGTGMLTFYDKIVPNALGALLKKTNSKLETVEISNRAEDFDAMDLDDATDAELAQLEQTGQVVELRQPGFDVTDTMRDKVRAGLPLFSAQRQQGPVVGDNFEIDEMSRADRGRRALQDDSLRMKRVIDAVKAQGGVVGEGQNFYDANVLMPGRVQAAMDDFRDNVWRPMLDKAVAADIDIDDLALYAYAKHAKERNAYIASINPRFADGGSGMTNADADQILADVAAGDKLAQYEDLHGDLMAITSTTRQTMLNEGMITQEEFDAMTGAYENYIPLRGFENVDEETGAMRPGIGRGINVRGKETIRALGRSSRAGDLIENALRDYERVVQRVEKNDVGKVLLDFVLSNPDPSLWSVDVEKTTAGFDKKRGVVQYTKTIEKGEDTIGVKVGGQQVYIKLADKELTRALRQAWKEEVSGLERATMAVSGWWNNWMRNVLTRYNPAFAAINLPRDALWSGTSAALADLGAKGLADYIKIYPQAMAAASRQEAGISGTSSKIFGNQTMDRYYQEFRAAGGITGGFYMRSLDDISSDLRTDMLQAGAKGRGVLESIRGSDAFRLARGTARALEFLGTASENATRFALYMAARENGKSPAQAGLLAKNGTTNFNRKGEWGGALNNTYLFYNASVQGLAQLLYVLKSPAVQKSMAGVAGVGMMLAFYGAAAGGEDEDGAAYWDKIPSFVKERNIVIMLPPGDSLGKGMERVGKRGRYILIPVQYGFNLFPNIGYSVADMLRNAQDPKRGFTPTKAALHLTSVLLGSVNPFGGAVDLSDGVQVLLAASPTLTDLPIQLVNERNSFGDPSAPTRMPFDMRPDSERMFTSQIDTVPAKIAKMLNEMGGGNEAKPGSILGVETSVTPGTIKTLISSTTGGLGTFMEQMTTSVLAMSSTDNDLKANSMPFVNKFYGEVDEGANMRLASERMREVKKTVDEVKNQFKLGLQPEIGTNEQRMLVLAEAQDTYQKLMTEMRKNEIAIIKSNMTEPEKKLLRQQIRVARDGLATQINKVYLSTLEEKK